MKKIENFIEHLESPSLDGIIFPNGKILLFEIHFGTYPIIFYNVNSILETSIDELNDKGQLNWSSCAVLTEVVDVVESIRVIAGECSYGSDGFIAVLEMNSSKLIWLAFFNNLNPFNEVFIKDHKIYAKSTYNCVWVFEIANPTSIMVEHRLC